MEDTGKMAEEAGVPREVLYAIMIAAMYDDAPEWYESEEVWYDERDEK